MLAADLQKEIREVESLMTYKLHGKLNFPSDEVTERFWAIQASCEHPILLVNNNDIILDAVPNNPFFIEDSTIFFCPVCRHYHSYDMRDYEYYQSRQLVYLCFHCLIPEWYNPDRPKESFLPYYKEGYKAFPNPNIMRFVTVVYERTLKEKARDLILSANPNMTLEELQKHLQTGLQHYLENEILNDVADITKQNPPVPLEYVEQYLVIKNPMDYIGGDNITSYVKTKLPRKR